MSHILAALDASIPALRIIPDSHGCAKVSPRACNYGSVKFRMEGSNSEWGDVFQKTALNTFPASASICDRVKNEFTLESTVIRHAFLKAYSLCSSPSQ